MSISGTDAYDSAGPLPPLVERALTAARAHGFPHSCRPEQGRLLHALAGGARHRIGETGTGCGVGLAWLASGAGEGVRLVSVERDPERAGIAAEVFVRVADGVEGLVHRDAVAGPSLPEVGDELSVEVVGINLVRRRVELKPAS